MRKKILFIGHIATRTGAPYILLQILESISKSKKYDCTLLLRRGGELEKEYSNFCKTLIWIPGTRVPGIFNSILEAANRFYIKLKIAFTKYDLVYVNSFSAIDVLNKIKIKKETPHILHVHELEHTIQFFLKNANYIGFESRFDFFICASLKCQVYLSENFKIPSAKSKVIYEFVPKVTKYESLNHKELKEKLNITEDEFVIGGSGTIDWRKGTDLFVYMVAELKRKNNGQKFKFIWVGGQGETNEFDRFETELKILGLKNEIIVTGIVSNPLDYYSLFDVFVLTSREDPFPLVCIEAAMLKKPIICFAESGGMPEFVDQNAGFIVNYPDIGDMANKILELNQNPELKKKLGSNAFNKANELLSDEIAIPKIVEVIENQFR